jgi:hypothetical protein
MFSEVVIAGILIFDKNLFILIRSSVRRHVNSEISHFIRLTILEVIAFISSHCALLTLTKTVFAALIRTVVLIIMRHSLQVINLS